MIKLKSATVQNTLQRINLSDFDIHNSHFAEPAKHSKIIILIGRPQKHTQYLTLSVKP